MARRSHIPDRIKQRVRAAARDRCGYCLAPQSMVMAHLEVEHLVPLSKGGTNEESLLPVLWFSSSIRENRYGWNTLHGTMDLPM
jgi:hypothetical protein